ncbi:MAG: SOS response-associated peptidase [Tabrizicola sp.]|nr:SOS response-associated peptidase [Tabrizicola sp.]
MLFAGLWSKVKLDDFEGLSCTIITEAASDKMSELHDRQPVMVPTEAITDWLGGCALVDLPRLKIEALAWHEVAAGVGRREAEGPDLVLPVNSQT